MKIILTSIGTRGDMEPFLAIGEILKEKGHQVIWGLSNKGKIILISPVPYLHYVKNHSHVAFTKERKRITGNQAAI